MNIIFAICVNAGYLKEEQCPKSYKTFLRECPFLNEYRLLLERGQECPTKIVGKGLKDMLEEYGQLKIQGKRFSVEKVESLNGF